MSDGRDPFERTGEADPFIEATRALQQADRRRKARRGIVWAGLAVLAVGVTGWAIGRAGWPGSRAAGQTTISGSVQAEEILQLAWVYAYDGAHRPAEVAFRRAIELDPEAAEAHNGLGWVYLWRGQCDEAEPHFRVAQRLRPGHPGVLNGLARCKKRQGQVDEAIELWRLADRDGGLHAAVHGLAVTYFELGDCAAARPYLERALEDPRQRERTERMLTECDFAADG